MLYIAVFLTLNNYKSVYILGINVKLLHYSMSNFYTIQCQTFTLLYIIYMMKNKYTIKRHLEKTLLETIKEYKCVILTGPRQVGKSTILNEGVLPKTHKTYKKIQLDDDESIKLATNDPVAFLQEHTPPVFIDEIQKAPRLFPYIKGIIDTNDENGQFVVTGSEAFELMKGVSDHLSTRAAIVRMQSLSQSEINGSSNFQFEPNYQEFLKRKQEIKTQKQIFESIIKGSMPDVINGKVSNIDIYYDTYVNSIVLKDMRQDWVDVKDIILFNKFLRVLASYIGQEIELTKIAFLSNITYRTAETWLNGLIAMNIILILHPYSSNALTRTSRKPKIYFFDTGLACYLTNMRDASSLIHSDYAGHIFECFVISEVCKGYINNARRPQLYYLRKHTNKQNKSGEIDLIIDGPNGVLYPIEIKMTATPDESYFTNFRLLKNEKNRIAPMTLICCATKSMTFGQDRLVLPVYWL